MVVLLDSVLHGKISSRTESVKDQSAVINVKTLEILIFFLPSVSGGPLPRLSTQRVFGSRYMTQLMESVHAAEENRRSDSHPEGMTDLP